MLFTCNRCHTPYAPAKSSSTLRLTYCSTLCERGDLGFTIDGLLDMHFVRQPAPAVPLFETELDAVLARLAAA